MTTITDTKVNTISADGIDVFYREAGDASAPVILLLHGYPGSSFSYRHLIPRLAVRYRVIAPDIPGFGFTVVPAEREYAYTFDNFAKTIEAFTDMLKLVKYSIYIFDHGAPIGLRLAISRPGRITAVISQNGNAFFEGLGTFWDQLRPYWAEQTPETRESIRWLTSFENTKRQYFMGESDPDAIPPETYHLDQYFLDRPGSAEIQLDIFLDYQHNITLYPLFQKYFRDNQPPLLAIWGENDQIFLPAGAQAFRTEIIDAEIALVNGGHFALENHVDEIADKILSFLGRQGI